MKNIRKTMFFLLLSLLIIGASGSLAQAQDNTFTNSIALKMVLIPAGSFMMGSYLKVENGNEDERGSDELSFAHRGGMEIRGASGYDRRLLFWRR